MVDALIDIPLPGRTFAAPAGDEVALRAPATLPSFVAGQENRVVAAVVGRLMGAVRGEVAIDSIAGSTPTLFALHGPVGVGKTHLARGLAEFWQSERGPESALYVTAADFRRTLHGALGKTSIAEIRRHFRSRELLVIDDLHQLPNEPAVLEELRAMLDECQDSGCIVLVTSPRAPSALENLSIDIRSRLVGGLVLQIDTPSAEARLQIVRQASAALGRPISDEAAGRLAAGVTGTANELFAALMNLSCGENGKPTQAADDLAQIENYLADRAKNRTSLRNIVAVVARYYRVPQKVLKSSTRKQAVVAARAAVVYLARELAGASYEQIGRALGGRDHSTIMHSYQTIDRQRRGDWQTRETIDELRRLLAGT